VHVLRRWMEWGGGGGAARAYEEERGIE
jgi:hypothetical protein